MFQYGKCVVRTLFLLLVCCSLSGCLSFGLILATDKEGNRHQSTWKSDTVTALSLGKDSNGKTGWVFVGEHFDYLLTQGGDNVVALLKDATIRRDKMRVKDGVKFLIDTDKKEFTGEVNVTYAWVDEKDKLAAVGYGFICADGAVNCTLSVMDLKGTIHQKNKDQSVTQQLAFYHPFTVEFYQYQRSMSGAKFGRVLLPVTLALDIVTMPLQLLIFSR
ncbi:hypothetical protein DNU48_12105 [Salmonella enterica subsp. enterica serovar Agona]|uniref:YidX family protein n=1 Tax=Salmonella enterica TaxID=28901 RepID=UPI0012C6F7B8|nr:hypothetical protein [Salmonella enterica]EBV0894193.1 hypothetical protein [Salmonella enterica subsp. enterica serovar Agona]EBV5603636.1 hypothetical protein [Salmonella enterica subsp. enterica serovar Agona]EBW7524082.1 hypothetical protein [Salmonella enterica subsp. enterica serovar Agona]ECA8564747.1 hypothetical protein [Salmonella enterica subsp. enterica serovar Agona]EDH5916350.1 hypothetical protein [Salmonella enterica subsp. enterica serovar Agona]